jgi:hypothetical protein
VLDNVTLADPPSAQFSASGSFSVSHAFEFVFPSVAPGGHTLRMFFKIGAGNGTVVFDERTVVVQHAP